MEKLVVEVETIIAAPPEVVWRTLTGPGATMMPGTNIETDWVVGHPITFSGEWQGKAFKDYGEIVDVVPGRELGFSHWSRTPEPPTDYHIVRYRLHPEGADTRVTLAQINVGEHPGIDEATRMEFAKNWTMMLATLKTAAEQA
jgi:uncharacterized protein YndB with AHSA1/START domain